VDRRRRSGLPDDLVERCDARVTIPMAPQVESLNAAVAGALLSTRAAAAAEADLLMSGCSATRGRGFAPPARRPPAARRSPSACGPRTLDDIVGQEHILAPGTPLRLAIERDVLQSIILWGPARNRARPRLARVIADATQARLCPSAPSSPASRNQWT
jgi:hypothetical protein